MQASTTWIPPVGALGDIVAEARDRAAALRSREGELAARAAESPERRSLLGALLGPRVGVIAEIKRRSPSKGWINPAISAADQALSYESGGAAAISVLTEPAHFSGSVSDLTSVLGAVRVPVLKKDFHVEPIQLLEAKAVGASAALLIVRALSPLVLPRMIDAARELELEVLVEVRDAPELERALDAGATMVGVNNRDLETLVIDYRTCERMLSAVPASIV
ncbi:MAG TPA: indole-3-glycerol phosphate synthase TrpC, partial [Gemmatimonadaceae bacterium]|nr:indole-3-glycerol phosphate synthase TrpC [Gemmatimonadaceae bacterium]